MKHLRYLGPLAKPPGHLERLLFVFAKSQAHRAQAAKRQKNVLRTRAHGESVIGLS